MYLHPEMHFTPEFPITERCVRPIIGIRCQQGLGFFSNKDNRLTDFEN